MCPTFCDPMDCSTPGFPVHYQLLELTQTHVHWVGDATKPSHPLSLSFPPALHFPASGSFPMRQLFASGGQSIGASASASVLPMSIQGWFPLGLTGLISLQVQGTLKCLLQHPSSKASILLRSAFFIAQFSHPYMTAATAAKSCQLCSTLCYPIDGSPPSSSIHGSFQARVLEWVSSTFSATYDYWYPKSTI